MIPIQWAVQGCISIVAHCRIGIVTVGVRCFCYLVSYSTTRMKKILSTRYLRESVSTAAVAPFADGEDHWYLPTCIPRNPLAPSPTSVKSKHQESEVM